MFNYKLARARNQLRYPKLWDGCFAAFCPSQTGPTGANLPNLVGRGDSAVLSDLTPPDAWVINGGYSAIDCPNIGPALTYELSGQPNTDNFSFTCWAKVADTASGNSLCYLDETNIVSLIVNIDDLCPDPLWNGTEGGGGTDLGDHDFIGKWAFFGMSVSSADDKIWTYSGPNGYVDTGYTTSVENINGTWYLGYGADANQMQCQIDDIRFYNRALCQNEMNLLARERGISYKRKVPLYIRAPRIIADFGSFVLNGQSATLTYASNVVLTAVYGSSVLNGQSTNLLFGRKLTASVASFSFNGQDASLKKGYVLSANVGSFSLNGQPATLTYTSNKTLTAANGSFALNGQSTNLLTNKKLIASAGSFSLSGQSASLAKGYKLTASAASFTLTGQSNNLLRGRKLTASNGSFSINGQSVNLTSPGRLSADSASFVLNGQVASLKVGYKLTASVGSFSLNGQSVIFRKGYSLIASNGSFTLTGQAATFRRALKLSAVKVDFNLNGQNVNLVVPNRLSADYVTFNLNGQSANLLFNHKLTAVYGSFNLSGQLANLTVNNTNRRRLSTRLLCYSV